MSGAGRFGKWVVLAIRLFLAFVFLLSGLAKVRRPGEFLNDVYGYELVGPVGARVVASALPGVEICIAACLLADIQTAGALAAAAVVCGGFFVVQSSAFLRGLKIPCGCFGSLDNGNTIDYWSLFRAAGLAGISLMGLIICERRRAMMTHPSRFIRNLKPGEKQTA